MNSLIVPFLPEAGYRDVINSKALAGNPVSLTFEPWPNPGIKPIVHFNIAYGSEAIFLHVSIEERHFKADYKQHNTPVFKDSCVEFFIGFDEIGYYNFEFNACGAILAGYGSGRERELLPVDLIEQMIITTNYNFKSDEMRPHRWQLNMSIPFKLFVKHTFSGVKGKKAKANFFKCGDDLPEPHFLCWNNIKSPLPNFHLPGFFGDLLFA
jgi:hypothetical protein